MAKAAIEDFYKEERRFPPPDEVRSRALIDDTSVYADGQDIEAFWATQARALLSWEEAFTNTLEWNPPHARWFDGGKLNASANCLDRHVANGLGERIAFHWEGEPGDRRTITYAELLADVKRFANALTALGITKGDRVNIYMGMVPELAVAMLACARIGAAHSVVFGGFSAEALRDRINDAEARLLITCDGAWRRGKKISLKDAADDAVAGSPSIENVIVLRRTQQEVGWTEGRDIWWHELMAGAGPECAPVPVDSEQLLYLLYTSGTTAQPKGIMHTTAGYLTQVAYTHKYVFDLHAENDVYWCAADIGWVTGHSYIVYGPLLNGATSVMYEGAPDFPDKDRWWSIIERYGVTILYTAPTAIRTFMKWGSEYLRRHDLSTLRILGTVGEPINPEAWIWYRENVGANRCPIVDTWWQTETGAHMIAPLPGVTTLKPGSATQALPGVAAEIVDEQGNPLPSGGGYLTLSKPWPSMLRGIWGDEERYVETYWSKFPGRYLAGDGARIDDEGYFWFLGRIDDVMNVSGHRISTAEVESALVSHESVAEAAVVGATDETTGQAIIAFVVLRTGNEPGNEHGAALREHVKQKLGAPSRPKTVIFVEDVPKTRSGKIMRRLLRDVAEGRSLGDTTTLADPAVVEDIRRRQARAPQED